MGQPRVLVVDDFPGSADAVAELLRLSRFDARAFVSGTSALAFASTWRPWAAVLDLLMPEMSGHELAARLRAQFGADLRLIALTGMDSERLVQRSAELGFCGHLIKPAPMKALLGMLGASGVTHSAWV